MLLSTLNTVGSLCSIISLVPEFFSFEIKKEIKRWTKYINNTNKNISIDDTVIWTVFFERRNLEYNPEKYPNHTILVEQLSQSTIPKKQIWLNAFLESWRERKGQKNLIDFFKIEEEEVLPLLKSLAFDIERLYSKNSDNFKVWTYQKLNNISCKLNDILFNFNKEGQDVNQLGIIICKKAFLLAFEKSIQTLNGIEIKNKESFLNDFENIDEKFSFESFNYNNATSSPFYEYLNKVLIDTANAINLDNDSKRQLELGTKIRFIPFLKLTMAEHANSDIFKSFSEMLNLNNDEQNRIEKLFKHTEFLKQLYEKEPVLGKQPFSLSQVYLNTECGILDWDEIYNKNKDPFIENKNNRHNLLNTVMNYIENEKFNDFIVIQGVAGAGKSSFTLHLANDLIKKGLHPIRIRLKLLDFDRLGSDIYSAISLSIEPSEICDKDLITNILFNEKVHIAPNFEICPYVLIFDGWDEITVGASEGFRQRVEGILGRIRRNFLENRQIPVRVILTGRPSDDLFQAGFLNSTTPILTIRPLRPDQIQRFGMLLKCATDNYIEDFINKDFDSWKLPEIDTFSSVFKKYDNYFSHYLENRNQNTATMDVLSQPLLAFLSYRLFAELDEKNLNDLVDNPSTLYRKLVDLTCKKSGKSHHDPCNEESHKISGLKLRLILQYVATMIHCVGEERISHDELWERLELESKNRSPELEKCLNDSLITYAMNINQEFLLSSLMISFFFKSGRAEQGCEFLHKSFREYLFAERIVESLKELDITNECLDFPLVENYYTDFNIQNNQGLWIFSRKLAFILSIHWLSDDIKKHIKALLEWEIERSISQKNIESSELVGNPSDPISIEKWKDIRTTIDILWKWWGEGIHLRPQVNKIQSRYYELTPSLVEDLIKWKLPQIFNRNEHSKSLTPARSTTIDGHLGDALYFLNVTLHSIFIQKNKKLNDKIVRFHPSYNHMDYFHFFISRIDSAGWYPHRSFLTNQIGSDLNLRNVNLTNIHFINSNFNNAIFNDSNLEQSHLNNSSFKNANFESANLFRTNLIQVNFEYSKCSRVNLKSTYIIDSNLEHIDLAHSDITNSDLKNLHLSFSNTSASLFNNSTLSNIDFMKSDIRNAEFKNSNLNEIDFSFSDLTRANFSESELKNCNFQKTTCIQINLSKVHISNLNFENSIIENANFENVYLNNSKFNNAKLSNSNFKNVHTKRAIFMDAILNDVNFEGSDFKNSDFRNADLSKANFKNVNIDNADFRGAKLFDTDFTQAINFKKALFDNDSLNEALT